jgi:predicted nucleic acid-binding protein
VSYLLDTCLLSELTRPRPDLGVTAWVAATPDHARFVSVISLAEIRFGILCAQAGQKRKKLEAWFEQELEPSLAGRTLAFDQPVALRWAALRAAHRNAAVLDSQIAATALEHDLTLVTRNIRDFRFQGLKTLNPWDRTQG